MRRQARGLAIAGALLFALAAGGTAWAQKSGGVFNNLVMYNQHEAQNRPDTIIPDLAESWAWSEDGKELTFKLRQGVKWHAGKPLTSADVKCTWDLLIGVGSEKLRVNPRKT